MLPHTPFPPGVARSSRRRNVNRVVHSMVRLPAGTIDYLDTGGPGPTVVLLHGLLMDGSLWDGVVTHLRQTHRCIVPTLPLGAHRRPMRPDSDLSLPGIARLTLEFLGALDLDSITLVGNDTGGALAQLIVNQDPTKIARLVLISCEAFDNIPPGLTGRTVALIGRLPPRLFGLFMQQLRLKPVRRLPLTFGWLTKRGDETVKAWVRPVLGDQQIRRDAVRLSRLAMSDRQLMETAAAALPRFERPALVIWAKDDRVMPPEHGRRLAGLLPRADLIEIDDSYTLIPLDQPAQLARALGAFVAATAR